MCTIARSSDEASQCRAYGQGDVDGELLFRCKDGIEYGEIDEGDGWRDKAKDARKVCESDKIKAVLF